MSKKNESIKTKMGYVEIKDSPRCDACNHAEAKHTAAIKPVWFCTKGGFITKATSRCNEFEPVKIGKS